jgi:hypothetical protein
LLVAVAEAETVLVSTAAQAAVALEATDLQ